MAKKTVIRLNHTLEEYNKKYGDKHGQIVNKVDADKDNSLIEGRTWWLIDEKYYEIPQSKCAPARWWTNMGTTGRVITCILGAGVIATAVAVPVALTMNQNTEYRAIIDPEVKDVTCTQKKLDNGALEVTLSYDTSKKELDSLEIYMGNAKLVLTQDYNLEGNVIVINADALARYGTKEIVIKPKLKDKPVTPVVDALAIDVTNVKQHKVGDKLDLTGIKILAHYSDGSEQQIDKNNVTFDPKEGTDLTTEGTLTIKATFEGISKNFEIKVDKAVIYVTGITCIKSLEMKIGDEISFDALDVKITPENATDKTYIVEEGGVHNGQYITIDQENRKIKAVGAGEQSVFVTAKGSDPGEMPVQATCNITVKTKKVESIEITNDPKEVEEGEEIELTAKVSPEDATYQVLDWCVLESPTGKAEIREDAEGKHYLKGLTEGEVVIQAEAQDSLTPAKTSATFKVTKPVLYNIDWATTGHSEFGQKESGEDKTLYDLATGCTDIIFGKMKKYEKDVEGLTAVEVGQSKDDKISAYYNDKIEGHRTLYVLSKGKIVFDDSDRPNKSFGFFAMCTNLLSITFENIDTSSVENMSNMFARCLNLEILDLTNFDTSSATNMEGFFNQNEGKENKLKSINLSSFDTSKVTNMNSMFRNCNNLESIDLSSFNTSEVISMNSMFRDCGKLNSLDLSSFNTSKVTSMLAMFNSCRSLKTIDLSSFDTSKVTNMSSMFNGCISLESINLSSFNTSEVTDMSYMFANCVKLETLDLSTFDTSKVTNILCMFSSDEKRGDMNLTTIFVSDLFVTTKISTIGNQLFTKCTKLVGGKGTACDGENNIDGTYAHIDGGTANPGYFTEKITSEEYFEFDILEGNNVSVGPASGVTFESKIVIPSKVDGKYVEGGIEGTTYNVTKVIGFEYLDELKSVKISEGIKEINQFCFNGCTNLENLSIPSTMEKICYSAFNNCNSLKNVNFLGSVRWMVKTSETFLWDPSKSTQEEIKDYLTSKYCSTEFIRIYPTLNNLHFFIPEESNEEGECCVEYSSKRVDNIFIPDEVDGSLCGGEEGKMYKVTKIRLSEGTQGREGAFENCEMQCLYLPSSITSFDDYSFSDCTELEYFVIESNSIQIIPNFCFRSCGKLTNIILPTSTTTIGANAFRNCGCLSKITLPKGVAAIYDQAFFGCESLSEINFDGTIDSWNSISKGEKWHLGCPETIVHCSDGDVTISEN